MIEFFHLSLACTMAPYQMSALNSSLVEDSSPPQSSLYSSSEIVVNVIFGTCALAIGIISIWQGHRAWRLWHPVQRHGTYELEGTRAPSIVHGKSWLTHGAYGIAMPPAYDQEQESSDVVYNGSSLDQRLDQSSTASLASSDRSQTLDMDVSDVDLAPLHNSEASLVSPVGLGGDMSLHQPIITEGQAGAQPSPQDINW